MIMMLTKKMQSSILLLASISSFECCLTPNNALHKLALMFHTYGIRVISNIQCKYVSYTIINQDELVNVIQTVEATVAVFASWPSATSPYTLDTEPIFRLLPQYCPPSRLYHIDYFERSWCNRALSDGSALREEPFIHTAFFEATPGGYFKRECYPDLRACGIRPYPEPTLTPWICKAPKKNYDLFCSFPQKDTGLRRACIRVSERLRRERKFNVIIKDDCTPDQYRAYVSGSYITLDAWGAGQINHRFLEIIALRSICCRQRYTVEFHADYDGRMIIEYSDEQELYDKLQRYLQMKSVLERMEEAAYSHYLKNHTVAAVGKYLVDIIIPQSAVH